ncbi:11916_t:CDS:2, partial [Racocetra fulgida]
EQIDLEQGQLMPTKFRNLREGEKQLKKDLKQLEETTNQPREYHIKEALIRYIEDMEDIRDVEKYIEKKEKGQIIWIQKAEEGLKEIDDRTMAENIRIRVENHLASHPTQNGKPLSGK